MCRENSAKKNSFWSVFIRVDQLYFVPIEYFKPQVKICSYKLFLCQKA